MRLIVFAAAAAVVLPASATAQPAPSSVCRNGELTRVRLSKIKPGGSMAGFNQAVAAHAGWYKAHGFKFSQRIAPVVTYADGKAKVSPDEVMTFATSDDVPRARHDAGWDAFVAKYRANSGVEKETVICMPK